MHSKRVHYWPSSTMERLATRILAAAVRNGKTAMAYLGPYQTSKMDLFGGK